MQISQDYNELLVSNLIAGLLFGILIVIPISGTPAIKHFVLRLVLWSDGYIPWNYAKFLKLFHKSSFSATSRWWLSLHPQNAARPLCPNGSLRAETFKADSISDVA